jgi:hypothetical protein
MMRFPGPLPVLALLVLSPALDAVAQARPRARTLGIAPGLLRPGTHNAITDVEGVRVGHATVIEGDSVRTGVTAILPHAGNAFFDRVPAAIHVGNGFGKLVGTTQVIELGELETAILLTCTLCVWRAADALVAYLLEQPGMQGVRSINRGGRDQRWLCAERHPAASSPAVACSGRDGRSQAGAGGRGERGGGHGNDRVWVEGWHRNIVPGYHARKELDCRCAGPVQLRRGPSHPRRPNRPRPRPQRSEDPD